MNDENHRGNIIWFEMTLFVPFGVPVDNVARGIRPLKRPLGQWQCRNTYACPIRLTDIRWK